MIKNISVIVVMLFLFNSCSRTINAWNGATPKEYLEIYGKNDLPDKLKEKKVEYRCVDLVYSSQGHTKKCYVTKNSAEKVDGWITRLYETSKGVLLDSGENMIILGILTLCSIGGDCSNVNFDRIKVRVNR